MTPNPDDQVSSYVAALKSALDRLPVPALSRFMQLIQQACANGNQIFIAGNGGSAAMASHMAADMAKSTLGRRLDVPDRRIRVMALCDNVPLMTAWANDFDYDSIFSEQLLTYGQPGDVLLALSVSGNSPNILKAAETAQTLGMTVLGMTGFDGGRLASLSHAAIIISSSDYGICEDMQSVFNHVLTAYLYASRRAATLSDARAGISVNGVQPSG